MSINDGARQEQKRLAIKLGLTAAQVISKSGADLMQAELAADAGTTVGAGKDGAYLSLQKGGAGA